MAVMPGERISKKSYLPVISTLRNDHNGYMLSILLELHFINIVYYQSHLRNNI